MSIDLMLIGEYYRVMAALAADFEELGYESVTIDGMFRIE